MPTIRTPRATIGSVELAELLGLSPCSIHSALCRRPERLPPPIRIPGSSRLLWRMVDVEAWLAQYAQPAPAKRRRGRPTKVEQLYRDPRTVDFIDGKADAEKAGGGEA